MINFVEHYQIQLPETRPFSIDSVKNDFLTDARDVLAGDTLAFERLCDRLRFVLSQKRDLAFSVALSMVSSPAQYRQLWTALCAVLTAQEGQTQFLAFPVSLVVGALQEGTLCSTVPQNVLAPFIESTDSLSFVPFWLTSECLSNMTASGWFEAVNNNQAPDFKEQNLTFETGQSVQTVYAVCYGANLQAKALGNGAFDLMNNLRTAFSPPSDCTLFVQPLPAQVPPQAQVVGNYWRQKLRRDMAISNAVRQLRLQGHTVNALLCAREGGQWICSIESGNDVLFPIHRHTHFLTPEEELSDFINDFLTLLQECHVENVRVLSEVCLQIPSFHQAKNHVGITINLLA